MMMMKRIAAAAVLLILVCSLTAAPNSSSQKLDEFGDLNCEEEYAHLDNLALQLQNDPEAKALIIFYGGRRFRGRLPKRGEAAARASRLKPYLVERRGIPSNRVEVLDGGYKEDFQIQLWVLPAAAPKPVTDQTIPAKDIRFRNGKATTRQFKCEI